VPQFGLDRLVALPLPAPRAAAAAAADEAAGGAAAGGAGGLVRDYKLQLSFDNDRFVTPWLPLLGPGAPRVPLVEVTLSRAGAELLAVAAKARRAPPLHFSPAARFARRAAAGEEQEVATAALLLCVLTLPLPPTHTSPPRAQVREAPGAYVRSHAVLLQEFGNPTRWPKHLLVRYRFETTADVDLNRGLYALLAACGAAFFLLSARALGGARGKLRRFAEEVLQGDAGAAKADAPKAD